jgi:hypothetical protein
MAARSFNLALGHFALAALRSHPDKLAKTRDVGSHPVIGPTHAAILGSGAAPTSGPLVSSIASRKNQGQCSGCTAHALAGGIETRCAYAKCEPSFPISMHEVYSCTLGWERAAATPAGQPLPPLQDTGAELADVIASVATMGVSKFLGPSPDGRNSDIWTAADVANIPNAPAPNVANEPDGSQLEEAASDPLAGAYTIDLTASDAVSKAVASITSGYTLYVGTFVDTAFMNLQNGQIAQPANQQDPNGGGHALYIADFRPSKTKPGELEFLVVNSWGPWAGGNEDDDGMVWASQEWLLACWECWCLDETLVPQRKAAA